MSVSSAHISLSLSRNEAMWRCHYANLTVWTLNCVLIVFLPLFCTWKKFGCLIITRFTKVIFHMIYTQTMLKEACKCFVCDPSSYLTSKTLEVYNAGMNLVAPQHWNKGIFRRVSTCLSFRFLLCDWLEVFLRKTKEKINFQLHHSNFTQVYKKLNAWLKVHLVDFIPARFLIFS